MTFESNKIYIFQSLAGKPPPESFRVKICIKTHFPVTKFLDKMMKAFWFYVRTFT